MKGVGIYATSYCGKPIHCDTLCEKHAKRRAEKLTAFGLREMYIETTEAELLSGMNIKLKSSHIHRLYRFRKGVIQVFVAGKNKWTETDLAVDHKLFCRRRN